MALFDKKPPIDKLWTAYNELPEEDKASFKARLMDIDKAEDERELDKIEEEKADSSEVEDEKAEEVKEESDEIGKKVDETEKLEDKDDAEKSAEEEREANDTRNDVAALREEMTALFDAVHAKIDGLTKKPVEAEPFGKAEENREYKAQARPKVTSDELIKKYFK